MQKLHSSYVLVFCFHHSTLYLKARLNAILAADYNFLAVYEEQAADIYSPETSFQISTALKITDQIGWAPTWEPYQKGC